LLVQDYLQKYYLHFHLGKFNLLLFGVKVTLTSEKKYLMRIKIK